VGLDLKLFAQRQTAAKTILLSGYDSTSRLKSFVGARHGAFWRFRTAGWRPYLFGGVRHASQLAAVIGSTACGHRSGPGGGSDSRMLIDQRETSAAAGRRGSAMDVLLRNRTSFFRRRTARGVWLAADWIQTTLSPLCGRGRIYRWMTRKA